ncbi:membrane dipeptidase [Bacillus lacus]|uniref:Membrane dipeptidase n=2 Tax=Metabacillus lacus TaxID=1983721 RepID=A0A7X2J0Y8_9BACI|nr:membrane dipeptidase [Metabacillus lacus]
MSVCAVSLFIWSSGLAQPAEAAPAKELDAKAIHFQSVVADSHNDTMMKAVNPDTWLPQTDIRGNTSFHIDIPMLHAGGLDVPFFAAYTSGYYGNTPRSLSRTLALINALYWTEERNSDVFTITPTVKEIEKAVKDGRIAAVPTVEGAYSIDKDNAIGLLHQYRDLGIRAITFTWNYSNALGEGANRTYGDPSRTPSQGGLTPLGKTVAEEMNKLGMIIDVSHMAESTFWDVMKVTKAPVMATHSGVYSLRNHVRNLTDDQLKAIAKNRGVVGVVFYPDFLTYGWPEKQNTLKDYVDHIDYIVNLIGIDYVALGSDFDGGPLPSDIQDSSELYKVTEELVKRGYSKKDIEKLLGKNTLRLLKEVEKLSNYNSNSDQNAIVIQPELKMGEEASSNTPLLQAKVTAKGSKLKREQLRMIVDGISYNPSYNEKTGIMSLQVTAELKEKFHTVTFEAAASSGKVAKETIIFYVSQ